MNKKNFGVFLSLFLFLASSGHVLAQSMEELERRLNQEYQDFFEETKTPQPASCWLEMKVSPEEAKSIKVALVTLGGEVDFQQGPVDRQSQVFIKINFGENRFSQVINLVEDKLGGVDLPSQNEFHQSWNSIRGDQLGVQTTSVGVGNGCSN